MYLSCMKTTFVILAALFLASCSKEKLQPVVTDQYITNVSWYSARVDGAVKGGFVFTVVSDNISKITLVRLPTKELEPISNPAASVHTIYDPAGLPSQAQNIFYQFQVITKSGKTVTLDKFQVY